MHAFTALATALLATTALAAPRERRPSPPPGAPSLNDPRIHVPYNATAAAALSKRQSGYAIPPAGSINVFFQSGPYDYTVYVIGDSGQIAAGLEVSEDDYWYDMDSWLPYVVSVHTGDTAVDGGGPQASNTWIAYGSQWVDTQTDSRCSQAASWVDLNCIIPAE